MQKNIAIAASGEPEFTSYQQAVLSVSIRAAETGEHPCRPSSPDVVPGVPRARRETSCTGQQQWLRLSRYWLRWRGFEMIKVLKIAKILATLKDVSVPVVLGFDSLPATPYWKLARRTV
ncbi:MAG: hypothetical protein ABI164_06440 [Acidobacteriaceae bacterium]